MVIFFCFVVFSVVLISLVYPDRLAGGAESMARWVSSFVRQDFSACADLDLMVDDHTLMRRDGTLVSAIEFHGSMQVPGQAEYLQMTGLVSALISNQMRPEDSGHDLQIVYRQDSGGAASSAIAQALTRSRATAARVGLDMGDVLDADEEILRNVVTEESVYVIISTNPSALKNPELIAGERKDRHAQAAAAKLPHLGFAQNPVRIISELLPPHKSFLSNVMDVFSQSGKTMSSLMTCHELVASIRREIQPLSTSPDYQPCLPGDHPPASTQNYGSRPWEDIYYPPIWSQLCTLPIKESASSAGGYERLFIDGLYHGTQAMDLPPQEMEKFAALMRRIRDIPFRISFRITPSGLKRYSMSSTLVQFLAFNPKSDNRRIKEAIEVIRERERGGDGLMNDPAMGIAITISTWHEDEKRLLRNMQTISRALQSWGGGDVLPSSGDPTDLFVSSLPGVSASSPSRYMLQNGSDVAKILPLTRPAAAWRDGAIIFTSLDGKMLPFQPGSSVQKAWVYLVFATMGSGKSVLLNTIELGMALAPGLSKLPMMTIIDVGESVSGPISMIQSSLPDSRKNEAGYFRVRMSAEYAYNVFDLQLGFRAPNARDRDFLRSFLSMIATPAGQQHGAPMMAELMGMIVDESYRLKSDQRNPNRYQPGVSPAVDAAIAGTACPVDIETTWWEITDALFARNRVPEAVLAQRFAVPNLQDIPNVLRTGAIKDVFGRTADGLALIETASIMVNSAIRDYPVLSTPTQWDIGMTRVIGIDLNDVKGHGEAGAKQTALMYAFAQQSAARNYYLNSEMLEQCPPAYKDYHRGRIEEIQAEIKAIIYDEFHNTRGIEGIRKIVSNDIREGRKWNIMTVLSSQILSDFDDDAIKNMTGTFILGANGNESVIEDCRRTFGLSDSAVSALRTDVTQPGVGLAVFNTKWGTSTMVFRNHLSAVKQWGFTSTAEDKALRRLLYDAMPASVARKMLARRFPHSGQFKAYVETRRNNMTDDEADAGLIRQVANEMILEYKANDQ